MTTAATLICQFVLGDIDGWLHPDTTNAYDDREITPMPLAFAGHHRIIQSIVADYRTQRTTKRFNDPRIDANKNGAAIRPRHLNKTR
jgi:hypothetical protein